MDNISHLTREIDRRERIKLVYADLRDPIGVNSVVEQTMPDFVFHLAAQSYPKVSFESPLDTYDTNIQGTETLLSAIQKFSPSSIVHVCASSEVFGRVPKEKLPKERAPTSSVESWLVRVIVTKGFLASAFPGEPLWRKASAAPVMPELRGHM